MHRIGPRHLLFSFALGLLACQTGCWGPFSRFFVRQPPQPQVLPPGAGLEQVIAAVNRNNSQIQSLLSNSATIKAPGAPTLNAHFAYQRPCFFRLRADTSLTGQEVDLGSNAQLFWFWVKRSQPPALYYCRHDQYATSPARRTIPIEPGWLIEALGTLEIDPAQQHSGPYPTQEKNRIAIRTRIETPEGPNMKVTIIDAVSAWVMEQQIYDAGGRLRARSVTEGYRLDPRTKIYVPTAVTVECPELAFSMRIDLGDMQVNEPLPNAGEMWTMPTIPGSPMVDLGNPNFRPAPPRVAGRR